MDGIKKIIAIASLLILVAVWGIAGQDEPVISNGSPVWPQYYNGTSFRNPRIDASTRTLQTIEYEHHEIHAGSHFFFTDQNTLASGGTSEYLFQTPSGSKETHLVYNLTGSAITAVYLIEGVEASGASVCTIHNSNRMKATTASGNVIYKTATAVTGGNTIWGIKSGSGTNQSRSPMSSLRGNEIILSSGVTYMFRTVSGTADNLTNIQLEWYEHTPKDN